MRQIVGGDQSSAFLHRGRQFPRHCSVIEVVRIRGNPLQRPRQIRLTENLCRLVVVAVPLKNAPRLGELAQIFIR